jgi:hypothetical protein
LKTWKANVTTIEEVKNLTKLSLEELISSLMTHEIVMKEQEWEVNPKRNLAFKIVHQIKDDDDNDNDDEDKKRNWRRHCTNYKPTLKLSEEETKKQKILKLHKI